jgi:putative tricarboxylic transport membrane protein
MATDISLQSLIAIISSPHMLMLLFVGVCIGLVFGILPGLGGKLGLVFLIPFTIGMEPLAGALFLLAMHSVVHTSGAIPSILFGIPGTGPDAATIIDGYPMAKNGEAGRALGATLLASGVGGVIGAAFLTLLLPFGNTLVLSIGVGEYFLLAVLGITFIASLSGRNILKGLIVGMFGLMLSFIRLDPLTAEPRYTYGQPFLWDGIDPITAVLAIFAIPEIIVLGSQLDQREIKSGPVGRYAFRQVFEGCLDVFRHRWLTLRTSLIGAVIGAIPGLGGDVATWFCYGHAAQTSKTPERFGHGAVEGVIAPETANNAKEGGGLVPTLYFGIPGSASMAILLSALVALGIQPGPQLAATGSNLVWVLIWTLALANILAVFILLACAPFFSLLAGIRVQLLVPFIIVMSFLGAVVNGGAWQNLIILGLLGSIGYLFRRYDWPRAPFVVGIVLGPIAEVSHHKAMEIWGPAFLTRPLALSLLALIAATIVTNIVRFWRQGKINEA